MEPINAIEQIRALENQVFVITAHKDYKSMMLSPEGILISSKRYDTADAFREGFAKGGGLLTTVGTIRYDKVKKFSHKENSDSLSISHQGMALGLPGDITFDNGAGDLHNVVTYLEKVQGFNRSEVQLTGGKAVLPNLLYVGLAILFTWVLYGMAGKTEAEEFHGRRRWAGELADSIAKAIGPVGVLLIGLAATGWFAWQAWKKFQNPPVEVRLER